MIKNYQMLVQPSIFEGFGLTVVEGMAAKIPVLVSDIDGPMEIIDNGQYGFHFKNGDIDDCAKKIDLLLNEYKSEECKNKINDAFSHANENFNIIKTAKNYLDNYFT